MEEMTLLVIQQEQHSVLKDLIHDLDVWHKSAKLVKALTEASNLKDCGTIRDWIEPITNHFWFCCQQAEGDLSALKLESTTGMTGSAHMDHLQQQRMENQYLTRVLRQWRPKVIMDKRWVESLIFYVWFKHTSFLENFNSMMLKYAPKRNSFDYIAFCIRMLLSALDHNMHTFRPQATTKDGKLIWKKQYSKCTKRWHPEPFKAEKSFEYIPYLMATILKARLDDKATAERVLSLPEEHPRHLAPTIALRESPELIDLVQEYQSRFQ
ncbi:PREDICTED: uncharacterized protein LOC107338235 isoform X2 [Acropora digitifera]|uniref:uncharacterized protein LOC107338235 isoform X2 n=1 Tax=Acropora digitifera TaxID=70779 RepID=UPI00077A893D|nr:PREDICTED: uncharacterized protein LOC107338235 isoform X2 [Acropora digitifera]